MNNLILAFLALTSASIVWLSQRNSIQAARAVNLGLTTEVANATALLFEATAALSNAQEALAARQADVMAVRQEATKTSDMVPITSVPPLDPAREGMWPADKPYCYLSKQHLETIGFVPFTHKECLSSDAATLFGMSATERSAVDNAYQSFLERTRQLQLTHADPAEPASGNTATHREIAYRVPALTNEFRNLRAMFADELRQAIGPSRADLFVRRADSELDHAFGQYGGRGEESGYTIRLYADLQPDGTVQHQLKLETLNRRASNGYVITYPLEPTSVLLQYRHLVGEEPLLQPTSQQ